MKKLFRTPEVPLFAVVCSLILLVFLAEKARADTWFVTAFDDGASYNVQIDSGEDVTAHGEGPIKSVTAGLHRVKVLSDGAVVAVTESGEVLPVVAVTDEGPVAVVAHLERGHVVDIKAIRADGEVLGVKALGPRDNSCAVKGLDLLPDEIEGAVAGVSYIAHVKAVCAAR